MNELSELVLNPASEFVPRWLRRDYDPFQIEKEEIPGKMALRTYERLGLNEVFISRGAFLEGELIYIQQDANKQIVRTGDGWEILPPLRKTYEECLKYISIVNFSDWKGVGALASSFAQSSYGCPNVRRIGFGTGKTSSARIFYWHAGLGKPTLAATAVADSSQGRLFLTTPVVTIEQRLGDLLYKLNSRAQQNIPLEKSAKALRRLIEEHPDSRTLLFMAVCRPGLHARLRWFGFEILGRYELPNFVSFLVNALADWPEDMALLGVTICLRVKKISTEFRSQLRKALVQRLIEKKTEESWNGKTVLNQLVAQYLGALGSFGHSDDLDLLHHFWTNNYDFVVRSCALEAAVRLARRNCESEATAVFFDVRFNEFIELAKALAIVRGVNPEMGSLFWSFIELLAVRLGDETKILQELAAKHPLIRRRLLKEISDAQSKLQLRHSEWLGRRAIEIDLLRKFLSE